MSIIEARELTEAELDEISGGESIGSGIYSTTLGGISFEYNSRTGTTYIWAGKTILECNSNGRCQV